MTHNKPWPYLDVPRGVAIVKYRHSYVGQPREHRRTIPGWQYSSHDDLGRLEAAIARRRRMHVGKLGHTKIRFRWWLDDHRRRATMFIRAVVLDVETHRLGGAA